MDPLPPAALAQLFINRQLVSWRCVQFIFPQQVQPQPGVLTVEVSVERHVLARTLPALGSVLPTIHYQLLLKIADRLILQQLWRNELRRTRDRSVRPHVTVLSL